MNDPTRHRFADFYRPLAHNFTRVFELDAGEFADPIVGRLVPQAMDAQPYEAISYVWGNPKDRRDIFVDGTTLSVTENLHGALTAFRHQPDAANKDEEGAQRQPIRRLWVRVSVYVVHLKHTLTSYIYSKGGRRVYQPGGFARTNITGRTHVPHLRWRLSRPFVAGLGRG